MPLPDDTTGSAPRAENARFRAIELDRHVGHRLRFLRLLSAWPQRELAGRIGLTFQQVQKYENATNRISAALLAELSGVFGLPMDWFAGPFAPAAGPMEPFAAILDVLFRGLQGRRDEEVAAAMDLLCTLARGAPGAGPGRLARLREAVRASTEEEAGFLLQAAERIAGPGQVLAAANRGEAGGGAVLLVDDDPDVRAMLTAALTSAGFAVAAAESGDEALAILSSRPGIDALVSDYAMVGMDGVDLMAHARQLRPGLPGLMITGFADAGRLRELPPGIEVLSKPFRRMELIGRVRILLEAWGQPAPASGMISA